MLRWVPAAKLEVLPLLAGVQGLLDVTCGPQQL